ncbi:unnamed protein product [Fraxinus pennsylvanica]|uniref:Homeobox domain-containing protein n=1 Tax=Fraxinus pennsylvanica TaxID=56036 RepID=A0AAD1YW05_9LAMI|nr:unnamed protein product [Fraxinus pennsylvanica]
MNSGYGGSGSGDERTSNSRRGKKPCRRHSTQQIQQLETFFKECPKPDENQRRQLCSELALDPNQIKFWFQNKRTQMKAQQERADNSTLRSENERLHCENSAMKEALNNVICPTCVGPRLGQEVRQHNLLKLRMENALLKEEVIVPPFYKKNQRLPRSGRRGELIFVTFYSMHGCLTHTPASWGIDGVQILALNYVEGRDELIHQCTAI